MLPRNWDVYNFVLNEIGFASISLFELRKKGLGYAPSELCNIIFFSNIFHFYG